MPCVPTPVAPVTPVGPVEPVTPVGPVGPLPVAPVGPVGPVPPVAPPPPPPPRPPSDSQRPVPEPRMVVPLGVAVLSASHVNAPDEPSPADDAPTVTMVSPSTRPLRDVSWLRRMLFLFVAM